MKLSPFQGFLFFNRWLPGRCPGLSSVVPLGLIPRNELAKSYHVTSAAFGVRQRICRFRVWRAYSQTTCLHHIFEPPRTPRTQSPSKKNFAPFAPFAVQNNPPPPPHLKETQPPRRQGAKKSPRQYFLVPWRNPWRLRDLAVFSGCVKDKLFGYKPRGGRLFWKLWTLTKGTGHPPHGASSIPRPQSGDSRRTPKAPPRRGHPLS